MIRATSVRRSLRWTMRSTKPCLQQELAGLEALGQFQPHGVPDRPLAGEADQRARLGQGDVALQGEAGRHAAHRRVGQDRDVQAAGLVVAGQGGRHLGHLHQRQDALLHAGPAAGAADDDQRQLQPVASSAARVSFSPTTEPMLPAMKAKSVMPSTTGRPRMKPRPTTAASGMPVLACSALRRSA